MPKLPPKICNHAGCGELTYKGGYCESHRQDKSGWHAYNKGKTRHERGYGYKWDLLRIKILMRDNHLCILCKGNGAMTAATEVDHIISKARGGNDMPGNLQGICEACHKEKTYNESRGREHDRGRG